MKRLDNLFGQLAAAPSDRALDQLEPKVWRRIAADRQARSQFDFLTPLRAAAVGMALVSGGLIGATTASATRDSIHEISVFSATPDLAPSTLLDGLG